MGESSPTPFNREILQIQPILWLYQLILIVGPLIFANPVSGPAVEDLRNILHTGSVNSQ